MLYTFTEDTPWGEKGKKVMTKGNISVTHEDYVDNKTLFFLLKLGVVEDGDKEEEKPLTFKQFQTYMDILFPKR